MESLIKLDNQFEAARERRKDAIILAFDGRTQQSIAAKSGIDATKLNKWINGIGGLEEEEIKSLEKFLGVDLK